MRLLLINPNGTVAMTDQAARSARRVAHKSTEIIEKTGILAPLSIEGFADEAMAVPSMLEQFARPKTTASMRL